MQDIPTETAGRSGGPFELFHNPQGGGQPMQVTVAFTIVCRHKKALAMTRVNQINKALRSNNMVCYKAKSQEKKKARNLN